MKMTGHSRLAPDLYKVFQHRGTRDADLRNYDATATKPNVVANLNKIIEPRSGADYGVLNGATINCRVGADFDVVLNYHSSELWDCQEPLFCLCEAKALLANAHARMQTYARAEQRMADADMSADPAIFTDRHIRPYARVWADPATWTYLHAVFDANESANLRCSIHHGTWGNERCWMDSWIDWHRGVEERSDPRPAFIRRCRYDRSG
jgi:hypothetical protein